MPKFTQSSSEPLYGILFIILFVVSPLPNSANETPVSGIYHVECGMSCVQQQRPTRSAQRQCEAELKGLCQPQRLMYDDDIFIFTLSLSLAVSIFRWFSNKSRLMAAGGKKTLISSDCVSSALGNPVKNYFFLFNCVALFCAALTARERCDRSLPNLCARDAIVNFIRFDTLY